jgi:hypothetical protein
MDTVLAFHDLHVYFRVRTFCRPTFSSMERTSMREHAACLLQHVVNTTYWSIDVVRRTVPVHTFNIIYPYSRETPKLGVSDFGGKRGTS